MKLLEGMYEKAVILNQRNIMDLLEKDPEARLLDLGCDEGSFTMRVASNIGTEHVHGVELVEERIALAETKGITIRKSDLNARLDWPDELFDVVHANQVIEHLHDSDYFLSEIWRVTKPGGYGVISTENGSSWCNPFAGAMGWQIFSLTNFSSRKQGVGNPLALHRDEETHMKSWNHVRIYNIRGMKEYFEAFDFQVEAIRGAGYFPFAARLGNIDRTHCHFMAFKIRKPPLVKTRQH